MFKLFGKEDFVGINYADDNATNQATTEDAGLILIWVQLQGSAHWLSAGEILKVTFMRQHMGAMVEHLLLSRAGKFQSNHAVRFLRRLKCAEIKRSVIAQRLCYLVSKWSTKNAPKMDCKLLPSIQ